MGRPTELEMDTQSYLQRSELFEFVQEIRGFLDIWSDCGGFLKNFSLEIQENSWNSAVSQVYPDDCAAT